MNFFYKTLFLTILTAITSLHVSANGPDTTNRTTNFSEIGFCNNEPSIVFSSMDWFKLVTIYNTEDGKVMFRQNIKSEARHQLSQLVIVDYSEWPCGEYVVVLRNGLKSKIIRIVRRETYD